MKKVFIDGRAGTTGLRIADRLSGRPDLELVSLSEEDRKNAACRKTALNQADIVFLCLPDAAAEEAAAMVENPDTAVLDTSTAHRTSPGWTYGFPELDPGQREKLRCSKRIAVPGCHASGFIALVRPLVDAGVLSEDSLLCCYSLTGYSGGGKKMIAQYETEPDALLKAPRIYGLGQRHKHLKEMQAMTGLWNAPVFCPVVSDFYSGMCVTVGLFREQMNDGMDAVKKTYAERYAGPVVSFADGADENGFLSAARLSGKDGMQIAVFGNEERILLAARYDNLGKGASGAAVQCMNLLLGTDETRGLEI